MECSTEDTASSWSEVPHRIRAGDVLPEPWESLFGPLRATSPAGAMVVGQIGQSIDGRIGTLSGHSHYINGSAGLDHLHRLRSVVDAVIVGAGTVRADDPQLTVRRVAGPNPARVVIDPGGTLSVSARVFAADGTRRIVITLEQTRSRTSNDIETIALPGSRDSSRPGCDPGCLVGAGLTTRADRGRCSDRVAFPHRRLPRSAACPGCAGNPGLRASQPRVASGRPHDRCAPRADPRPPIGRRGAV